MPIMLCIRNAIGLIGEFLYVLCNLIFEKGVFTTLFVHFVPIADENPDRRGSHTLERLQFCLILTAMIHLPV